MQIEEQNIISELSTDIGNALTFTIGGTAADIAFETPVCVKESKLAPRYRLDGEFSTDEVDGTVSTEYRISKGMANITQLTFTLEGRDMFTLDYTNAHDFISTLQSAYSLYKAHKNRPAHNLAARTLAEEILENFDTNSTETTKSMLKELIGKL